MLQAARAGAFDFVIAESLSRIARDEEDSPAIRKRLDFAGVKIVTTTDGVVSPLMHGLRTIIDAHYLVDLKSAVRRGMTGVIRDGRHPGGKAYGYRPIAGKPGELEIVPNEADVVRRIFREYVVDGDRARAIATRLNAELVPPPRGRWWRVSTIGGHTKRKTGILQNELYCGRMTWNRACKVRDPDTGRHVYRSKPESEWQRNEAPHLRIIDDDTFEAAQRIRQQRTRAPRRDRQRPKRLLSGLLRCGACGGGMSKKDNDHGRPRIICTQMRDARACSHRRHYYLDEIERMVVGGLRAELGTREAVTYFVRCYNEERRRSSANAVSARFELQVQLATVDRQIARAVAAVIEDRITREEADQHLPALRARRADLAAQLVATEEPPAVITLQPAAIDAYLRDLDHLEEVINQDLAEGDEGAAKAIRSLVDTVTVMPTPAGRPPGVIVRGRLESLLGLDTFQRGSQIGGEGGAG
jgi:site-specific DNA recombinase